MNLTDIDNDYSNAGRDTAERVMFLRARHVQVTTGAPPQQLGGIFKRVKQSLKRTLFDFPLAIVKATGNAKKMANVFKTEFKELKGDVMSFAPVVAPVAQLFPGIGTVVGLVVGAANVVFRKEAAKKKAKLQMATERQTLVDEYKKIAGTTPGRMLGVDTLGQVYDAAVALNALPVAVDLGAYLALARQGATAGATADQVVDAFGTQNPTVNPHLTTGSLLRHLLRDYADAIIGQMNPSAPYSYAITQADIEGATGPEVLQPDDTKSYAQGTPAISTKGPEPVFAPTDQSRIESMLSAMREQGANQASMFQGLMTALAQGGADVNAPQVQAAAKAEVQKATSLAKTNPLLVGGLILGAVFLLGKSGRRR